MIGTLAAGAVVDWQPASLPGGGVLGSLAAGGGGGLAAMPMWGGSPGRVIHRGR